MKYKAVLFDLDGTLLDTIEDLTDAMNAALGRLGSRLRTAGECKFFVGAGVDNFARAALSEDRRDPQTVKRCVQLMREDYTKRWMLKTHPYDGITELLTTLSEREISPVVLSNKPDDFTKKMVAHFFGGTDFGIVLGACDDAPPKPDPTAALRIADKLKLPPDSFLYLGDTDIDMQTANSAGMYAIGAAWGFRPRDELIANGARKLIDHPAELLDLL